MKMLKLFLQSILVFCFLLNKGECSCPAHNVDINQLLTLTPFNSSSLDCGGEGLFGQISPEGIQNLTLLSPDITIIVLPENQLSGSLPSEISLLTNLQELVMFGNQLNGTIPGEIGLLSKLDFLDLGLNEFSGKIPLEIFSLTHLTTLYLDGNKLTGTISSKLGDLSNLMLLVLEDDAFTGTIPSRLGELTELTALSIGSNQLEGTFPTEILLLTALTSLHIKPNNFTGTMPNFNSSQITNTDTFPGEVFSNLTDPEPDSDTGRKLAVIVGSSIAAIFAFVIIGVAVFLSVRPTSNVEEKDAVRIKA